MRPPAARSYGARGGTGVRLSWASVGNQTGKVLVVREAPDEPGAMDFLVEALR